MSHKVGDKVTFEGERAVVTSATESGYDVAKATETSGGRCRQMHIDVSGDRLEKGFPDSDD